MSGPPIDDSGVASLGGLPTGGPGGQPHPELAVGTRLAHRYRILGEVGRGGFGVVYRARDERLDRDVALKVVRGGDRDLEVLRREARVVARLAHPAIVTLHDFGEEAGLWYTVSEYLEGGSLEERLRREGALGEAETHELARELASGLRHAHSRGVIHRDLKPGNILFTADGRPKLGDFGLAHQEGGGGTGLSAWGAGTPYYAAPAQLRRAADASKQSDLFSLAATLYRAVTGETPHALRLERVPRSLRTALAMALEADPARRPASVHAFLQLLEVRTVELPVAQLAPSPPTPPASSPGAPAPLGGPSPGPPAPRRPPLEHPPPPAPAPARRGCCFRRALGCVLLLALLGVGIWAVVGKPWRSWPAWRFSSESVHQGWCARADSSLDLPRFRQLADRYAEAYPGSAAARSYTESARMLQEAEASLADGLGEQAQLTLNALPLRNLELGVNLQQRIGALWHAHDQACQAAWESQGQGALFRAARAFSQAFPSDPRAVEWLDRAGWRQRK